MWGYVDSIRKSNNYEKWRRKRDILRLLKTTAGCADCGYDANGVALDFDHLSGKKFTISQAMDRGWKKLFAEIMKCEVRCANCHRIKTEERRDQIVSSI